ncbi:hypothetical protein [Streptomyces spiralis]|uniref:hypothetical protein n=1 Tax=Streptomyces spiralis TaxID=66376 RepID=UPI001673B1C0|nr:hypothetical protein [Streptomyces spiralis]
MDGWVGRLDGKASGGAASGSGPRPEGLRQAWQDAKDALKEARALPTHVAGPGTQVRMRSTLSGALDDAVTEKLISENWTKGVVLPEYVRPRPLVWTPARIEAWRQTGEKPRKVMVRMPEQTGEFLDAVGGHRLYPMFHLMIFRVLRRGEAAGLPWAETDLVRAAAVRGRPGRGSRSLWSRAGPRRTATSHTSRPRRTPPRRPRIPATFPARTPPDGSFPRRSH